MEQYTNLLIQKIFILIVDFSMEKKKESKVFLGCMFIGLGAGFIFDNIPGGILIGMGIGFLAQHFSSRE